MLGFCQDNSAITPPDTTNTTQPRPQLAIMTVPPAAASIQDPNLQQCLEVAERTRQLCHTIVSSLETTSAEQESQNQIERSRKLKQLNALLQQLKCLHRSAVMSSRVAKDATRDARQEVDRLHLQLQNLYYEQRHLRGEINACIEFPFVSQPMHNSHY